MDLWGKKSASELVDDAEAPGKGDPIQDMILKMVAKNPAIAEAFSGIQGMLQQFTDTATRIEQQNQQILYLLMRTNAAVLNSLPGLPTGEGRGVIADGTRCVYCGSTGECHPDCPSHTDPAFSGAGPVPGPGDIIAGKPSGGDGGGGDGNLDSNGNAVRTTDNAGA